MARGTSALITCGYFASVKPGAGFHASRPTIQMTVPRLPGPSGVPYLGKEVSKNVAVTCGQRLNESNRTAKQEAVRRSGVKQYPVSRLNLRALLASSYHAQGLVSRLCSPQDLALQSIRFRFEAHSLRAFAKLSSQAWAQACRPRVLLLQLSLLASPA